jgi:hypothetical protein
VAFFGVAWLPPMEAWFSGLIPYPTLLVIQILMSGAMIKISADIWRGAGFFAVDATDPNHDREISTGGLNRPQRLNGLNLLNHKFLIGFSAVYAGSMVVRYVVTMIVRPEMRWFGGTIPVFFHFVLAAFIFIWGRYYASARCIVDPIPSQ